jgi:eukaryotic-like serine/threonine-protein kinase
LDSLAAAYEIAGQPEEAVRIWKDVYTRTSTKSGRDSNEGLNRSDSLASGYENVGRIAEAALQREESLRGRRTRATGPLDPGVAYALWRAAALYDRVPDYARAELRWREALLYFTDAKNLAILQASLGRCLLRTGKPADAETALRQCLLLRDKTGPDGWSTFHARSMLGAALLAQKKYAEAEPLLLAGHDGMKKREQMTPVESEHEMPDAAERLVQLYEATNRKDEAVRWRKIWERSRTWAKNRTSP